ncbi:MAG: VIT1/CCC1 transporter family protein [Spirochaetales bacterium]|nr:VIT1/CCC1 transporter family protein [Spirochaetales bacterium]
MKEFRQNQKDEINGYTIYAILAESVKDEHNSNLLLQIANDEKKHYELLRTYSGLDVKASKITVFLTVLWAKVFGLTFTLKLMEKGEKNAPLSYKILVKNFPELKTILEDEDDHEKELLDMLNEESLNYMGSVVLGLNDALVELSGALAGFTFAIQDSRTIALMGLITGISASFSMAASEYLSKKEENEENPLLSSIYTGIAYIITVILLVLPFFLFPNHFINLATTIVIAVLIIMVFNFYISVAKDLPFKRRFLQMAGISVGVALLSFGIGWIVKTFLGFDI